MALAETSIEPTPREAFRPALLSIVVPAYNEADNVVAFHRAMRVAMRDLDQPFEVVFVNDGSRDATLAHMKALRARHTNTTVVNLSRNFGKEIAITAGLDHAKGEAVVIMDADLQHPPHVIADMIDGWRAGYDVVYGVRRARAGESLLKRTTAQAFYRLMRKMGRVEMPENAGDFRLLSRKAVDAVCALREHHRFMKGVFAWVGFAAKPVVFDVAPRHAGVSKFNFWTLWNFSLEGLTSHTMAPLKASTYLGLVVACIAFLYGGYTIAKTLLFGDPVPGYPTLVTVVLFLGGVELIVLGVIGEYLGRIFNETKNRPLYFVSDVMEAEAPAPNAAGLTVDNTHASPHPSSQPSPAA